MGHTPGPWQIKNEYDGRTVVIANVDGESFSDGTVSYSYDFICDTAVDELGECTDLPTAEANAILIAAAPDLLEALEAQERAENAHANCPDCEGEGDWTECGRCSELFGDAIDMRRAAIAKATT